MRLGTVQKGSGLAGSAWPCAQSCMVAKFSYENKLHTHNAIYTLHTAGECYTHLYSIVFTMGVILTTLLLLTGIMFVIVKPGEDVTVIDGVLNGVNRAEIGSQRMRMVNGGGG